MSRQLKSYTLQDEVLTLCQEPGIEKNRHLRTLADYGNYCKRVERDVKSGSSRDKKELIRGLLAVLDNLERAFGQIQEEKVRQVLQVVHRQFLDLLAAAWVAAQR